MQPEDVFMRFEAQVSDIITRTYNVKSFRFAKPRSFSYKPGQFMFVTVRSGAQQLRKHFSISSSPTETNFIEFTKKITDHPFSLALIAINIGDTVNLDGPYGNFTFEGEHDQVGMLSGGIGITPLRSICKYCTDTQSETKITLLYGNRAEEDIIFRRELEEMQQKNRRIKVVFTLDQASQSWKGYTGIINAEMVKNEIPDYKQTSFYTCGSPAMVVAIENLLRELGISESQIKKENFPGY
jgi:ferredoxin-NADP reductase